MAKRATDEKPTIIRDAVHGDVELDSSLLAVLDSPQVQRLRFVRQLASAYLVFPSAHHSRFEHSLGTYYLTNQICGRLVDDEDKARHVELAALLHDIGHPAFSHTAEPVVGAITGCNHEEVGAELVSSGPLSDEIARCGYSVQTLKRIMTGKDKHSAIICGDLGTDRMDYLLRDAYFCGVPYSMVDAQRLLQSMRFCGDELVVPAKGIRAAESLLVSRHLMLTSIYLHHAVRIAQEMLRTALMLSLSSCSLSASDIAYGTDDYLLFSMAKSGNPLAVRMLQRKLFKRVYCAPAEFSSKQEMVKRMSELCSALCDAVGEGNFAVSPPQMHSSDISFKVEEAGRVKKLVECSAMARALEAERAERYLIVAADKRDFGKVSAACSKVLGN